MAGDIVVTVVGNITNDPELRYTPSGAAVCNFTVASTSRSYDKAAGDWVDGQTVYMRCSVWRGQAENVAQTLLRSSRVVVTGRLKARSYTTKEGDERTVLEMEVDEVGASLRYAIAKLTKSERP